jgi:acyl-CoA synthetase (AMP-forming)/AMP-acid ligase II
MDYNIAHTLSLMAEAHPYQEAVIFPEGRDAMGRVAYTRLTYQQLEEASNRMARGLMAYGIGRGMRTAFLVKPSLEFFITTFALFKAKAVPVLIDPGIGLRNMRRCLAESQAEAFVGIPAAHAARILFRWKGGGWKRKVTISRRALFGGLSLNDLEKAGDQNQSVPLEPAREHELAAILFTSGSTGAPKGAVYTHGNFLAQVQLLKDTLGIQPGEKDLCTFPLFALFAPALGMSAVIPEMDFTRPKDVDPEKIAEAIHNFGISNMFGSPALIKTVANYGVERHWHFPTLKRVISAGAPVQAAVIAQFRRLLNEECFLYTPYGATESLPLAIAESHMILRETSALTDQGHGICVGTVVPRTDVRIIRISDQPIASWDPEWELTRGEIGEVVVSGDQVTSTYYQRESATQLAKIRDPATGRIWHRMGDLGYFDAMGRLWFCGRKAHRVQTQDGNLFTINCEGVFNKHPLVARTALVGLGQAGMEKPLLCVEPKKSLTPEEETQLFIELKRLGAAHEHTRNIKLFLTHDSFPVDIRHNAKIFREKLKSWAEAQWRKKSLSPVGAAFLEKPSSSN